METVGILDFGTPILESLTCVGVFVLLRESLGQSQHFLLGMVPMIS